VVDASVADDTRAVRESQKINGLVTRIKWLRADEYILAEVTKRAGDS
jgi:hypothetical protein